MANVLPTFAVVLSALVALSDLYARRVPNAWLAATLVLAVTAGLLEWIAGMPEPAWPSVFGLSMGLITMLPFYAIRAMGAGDVKFFATLGFLLGTSALLPIWIVACLLTGAHAVIVLVLRMPHLAYAPGIAAARQRLHALPLWQRAMHARQGRVGQPHATYLSVATVLIVLHPQLLHWGQL